LTKIIEQGFKIIFLIGKDLLLMILIESTTQKNIVMRGMRGIQFVYDSQGNKTTAVVDLRRYGKEFALFLDQLAKKKSGNSNNRPTHNTNPVIGDTINNIGAGGSSINTKKIKLDALLKKARSYYGVPYRTGGTTSSGMDCSGFVQTSFKAIGVNLPRVSRDQARAGTAVRKDALQAGDLVFFATGTPGRVNHVGIVTNASNKNSIKFIHASSSRGIMETSMAINYWQRSYMNGKRVV
jgi:cell wall-associated NlpC family hydrolase